MGNQFNFSEDFEEWCINNKRTDLLSLWDYELNKKTPKEISAKTRKKYYFKCARGIHSSKETIILSLTTGKQQFPVCDYCRSFAQYIIDNYDRKYLDELIALNPDVDLWHIRARSNKNKLNIVCYKNKNHKYQQTPDVFNMNGCGYCSHKYPPLREDSLPMKYPKMLNYWSTKNKKDPYSFYPQSAEKVWWKCPNGGHEDFQAQIYSAVNHNFHCQKCSNKQRGLEQRHNLLGQRFGSLLVVDADVERTEKKHETYWFCQCDCGTLKSIRSAALLKGEILTCGNRTIHNSGENNGNWKGGVCSANMLERGSKEYSDWRLECYRKDYYICQCCGNNESGLNAHHIYNFSKYPELRYKKSNGITLCETCHSMIEKGSFHSVYGVRNNTPEQLEEYINNKRKELGINIPFNIEDYLNGNILKPNDIERNAV